jgi:hypothetical protein
MISCVVCAVGVLCWPLAPGPLGAGQLMTTAGLEVLKAQYNVSVSSQAPQALAQDAATHQRAAHLVERIAAAVTAKLNNATMAVQVRARRGFAPFVGVTTNDGRSGAWGANGGLCARECARHRLLTVRIQLAPAKPTMQVTCECGGAGHLGDAESTGQHAAPRGPAPVRVLQRTAAGSRVRWGLSDGCEPQRVLRPREAIG